MRALVAQIRENSTRMMQLFSPVNSMAPARWCSNLKLIIFKLIKTDILRICICYIFVHALRLYKIFIIDNDLLPVI